MPACLPAPLTLHKQLKIALNGECGREHAVELAMLLDKLYLIASRQKFEVGGACTEGVVWSLQKACGGYYFTI